MLRLPRARPPLALFALSLVSLACSSDRYSLRHTTAAGQVSEVRVLGKQPRIEVEAFGSGALRVVMNGTGDGAAFATTLRGTAAQQTLPGPVVLRLTPLDSASVEWRLEAWGCEGLAADLLVEGAGGD